eukprot:TRINITY_DN1115_c0_g1_i5.p1 TRINITY_DN1115_c0_g1~~TRINITY_DN1115_c0_g1_i5.p1  ORF type:complete len:215 (+),score=54.63 TRINITY_DN1115_c0_g1_i5:45-689(+)
MRVTSLLVVCAVAVVLAEDQASGGDCEGAHCSTCQLGAAAATAVAGAIAGRRSHRTYTPEPLPDPVVDRLLWAATWAPTAKNTQQVSFTLVKSADAIRRLEAVVSADLGVPFAIFYGAPLVVFLSAPDPDRQNWGPEDCNLAAQNMMLMGEALGVGSCYIGLAHTLNNHPEVLHNVLGLPENHQIFATLIFGYPLPDSSSSVVPRDPPNVLKVI